MTLTFLRLSHQQPRKRASSLYVVQESKELNACKSITKIRFDFLSKNVLTEINCDVEANKNVDITGYECVQLSQRRRLPTGHYKKHGNIAYYKNKRTTVFTGCELRCKRKDCRMLSTPEIKALTPNVNTQRISKRSINDRVPCKYTLKHRLDLDFNLFEFECANNSDLNVPGYECFQIEQKQVLPTVHFIKHKNKTYYQKKRTSVKIGCELRRKGTS